MLLMSLDAKKVTEVTAVNLFHIAPSAVYDVSFRSIMSVIKISLRRKASDATDHY